MYTTNNNNHQQPPTTKEWKGFGDFSYFTRFDGGVLE
jgi:hypothetical protein